MRRSLLVAFVVATFALSTLAGECKDGTPFNFVFTIQSKQGSTDKYQTTKVDGKEVELVLYAESRVRFVVSRRWFVLLRDDQLDGWKRRGSKGLNHNLSRKLGRSIPRKYLTHKAFREIELVDHLLKIGSFEMHLENASKKDFANVEKPREVAKETWTEIGSFFEDDNQLSNRSDPGELTFCWEVPDSKSHNKYYNARFKGNFSLVDLYVSSSKHGFFMGSLDDGPSMIGDVDVDDSESDSSANAPNQTIHSPMEWKGPIHTCNEFDIRELPYSDVSFGVAFMFASLSTFLLLSTIIFHRCVLVDSPAVIMLKKKKT